jgi:hypothetical protein
LLVTKEPALEHLGVAALQEKPTPRRQKPSSATIAAVFKHFMGLFSTCSRCQLNCQSSSL